MKETFPPRPRFKWLFITIRLSINNFAGSARTLVAVGTSSDASIFVTTLDAVPRSGSTRAALGDEITGAALRTGSAGSGVELLELVTTCGCSGFPCCGAAAVGVAAVGVAAVGVAAVGAAAVGVDGICMAAR
ncbi:unannotated protein [freshwater metagenome]|uniref:Unannotated protein n=1 Tax=freshwater metagenome TaxID=449393 RepID=A0A6J7E1D5_9ZZZZ